MKRCSKCGQGILTKGKVKEINDLIRESEKSQIESKRIQKELRKLFFLN